MSRATFISAGLAFLGVALALQLLHFWLRPEPASATLLIGYGIKALIIYLICLVPALILWAFARFRLEHVLVPLVVLGGLVVLASIAGVAANKLPTLFGAVIDRAGANSTFRASYIASAKQSCIKSAEARVQGRLSAEQIASYCGCTAQRSATRLSGSDLTALVMDRGNLPPELRSRLMAIVRSCAAETLLHR